MYLYHELIEVKDITNKEEVLNVLSNVYTDEDFNGNNGEEFTREEALEGGFESTQEYVIDNLRKSDLKGEEIIVEFFKEWLADDDYYDNWDFKGRFVGNNSYVCSVVAINI